MNFEVPAKVFNALAQQRNLHFRRAGVRWMDPELLDLLLFLRFSNPHFSALFSLSFLVGVFLSHEYWIVKSQCCRSGAAAHQKFSR